MQPSENYSHITKLKDRMRKAEICIEFLIEKVSELEAENLELKKQYKETEVKATQMSQTPKVQKHQSYLTTKHHIFEWCSLPEDLQDYIRIRNDFMFGHYTYMYHTCGESNEEEMAIKLDNFLIEQIGYNPFDKNEEILILIDW